MLFTSAFPLPNIPRASAIAANHADRKPLQPASNIQHPVLLLHAPVALTAQSRVQVIRTSGSPKCPADATSPAPRPFNALSAASTPHPSQIGSYSSCTQPEDCSSSYLS